MARIDFTRKINEYKEKSDEEILQFLSDFWGIKPDVNGVFTLVARYKKSETRDKRGNEFGMFVDVRNTIGDILYYPFFLGTVSVWTKCNPKFEKQDYWQISVKLSDKKYRGKNPFALTMANTIVGLPSMKYKDKLEKEILIKKIFEETGSTERDAKNTSNALHAIMGDLYTETERFIFELLQNADDQPKEDSMVEVTLKTLDENLLFLHSGKPFSNEDVESISSIGDSTKKNDSEKTGYKGIGFKSVFSDAETVFINSGNFSFAFDKHSPVYPADANMDEIPWQIKPIWEEKYRLPKEVQGEERFFTSPVAIALNVGTENVDNYERIIPKLLSEPRFVLFLRNIGKIIFIDNNGNTIEIQKSISENIIQVTSNELNENWIIKDFVIPIPPETIEEIQNEKLIPAKLKQATRTKITFAARIDDNKIVPVNNSVLFTYLPTKVNDFDFPFLVNADFLTTASRESIHFKNIWNRFLFTQIGSLIVDWVESLKEHEGALCVLPLHTIGENNVLYSDFMSTYKDALIQKEFIKGHKGNILPQNRIILDETGLSNIIGKEMFCEVLDTQKQLPYYETDTSVLKHDLYGEVTRIRYEDIKESLSVHKGLYNWYINADEGDKTNLNKWLSDNNCKKIIRTLPLFHYSDGWKSVNDVEGDANRVLLSESLSYIKGLLYKLGFECPDSYIENNPFADILKKTDEGYLFNEIVARAGKTKLSPEEKLLIVTTKFEGVGEKKISQVELFCNELGKAKALANMVAYRGNAQMWLKPYMICRDENNENISCFLITNEEIYSKIIEYEFKEIINHISLKDLFLQFKDTWTLLFTKKIINHYGVTEDTLSLVELQEPDAKLFFLQKITNIPIDINVRYQEADFVCRVLRIAFEMYSDEQIRSFASKLFIGERSVASFTVSDKISFEYHEGKRMQIKLSDLLPNSNDYNIVQRIKECLSVFNSSELERLLSLVPMTTKDVWLKIDKSKGYTPAQYILGIYRTRKVNHYYASYVPNIDLYKADDNWINILLDILYDQRIELFDDSFGYRLSSYFKGYFNCEYVNDEERVLPAIEKWADTDDKRSYLISLGVKTERAKLIQLRKSIINNEPINSTDVESQKEHIGSSMNLFASKGLLPFAGDNQTSAMRLFESYSRQLISKFDIDILCSLSTEYDLPEYISWKTDDKMTICLYEKAMPKQLIYTSKNIIVCKYDEGDYHYESSNKTLYINSTCNIRDILYSLVSDKLVPFEATDWQKFYYDNLVSKSEVESKDKEIQDLKDELEKYKQRFGSLKGYSEKPLDESGEDKKNKKHEESNETEVREHGKDTDKDAIDEDTRKDINHDARIAAKEYLECLPDYDCTEWNPEESSHLVCDVVKYKGEPITIAVTSSRSRKLYLHPRVFAEIMCNPHNLLLNYGADNRIHSLSFDDVFMDNPNVNLIFDTDVISPTEIAELANKYMSSKRTCFVIENPKYSTSDTIQSFGLNEKKEDGWVNVDISEDDIFNW